MELPDGRFAGEWDQVRQAPQGHGLKCWTSGVLRGAIYDGQWRCGSMVGDGRMIHPDGEEYSGQWKDGKANGQGVYCRLDGSRYEGQWRENQACGEGVEIWPSGERYVGQHVANLRHGTGTWVWADGSSYEGTWESDRRVGSGKLTLRSGKVITLRAEGHDHVKMDENMAPYNEAPPVDYFPSQMTLDTEPEQESPSTCRMG